MPKESHMSRKNISFILILSLISSIIVSCSKPPRNEIIATLAELPKVENEIIPYYSITTQYASHRVNYFMDVDIKIPKITYTGVENDKLFDSINNELYENITKLVKDAMNESLDVYSDYLETAKANVLEEQERRMRGLKTKYKDVIGEKEIEAINETIENLKIVAKENQDNANSSKEVTGFSSTEGLIIPGLHNKNIIIVETTEASTSEITKGNNTSNPENNRPNFDENGKMNIKGGERPNFGNGEKRKGTTSNADRVSDEKKNANQKNVVASKSNIENEPKKFHDTIKLPYLASESNANKKLTLKDFYDEFAEILSMKAPSNEELTKAYTPTTINCNFDVKCLDEEYLSLFVELNVTKTVPSITRLFYNIDLRKKAIVSIKDVLGENYKELCLNSINKAIDKMTEEQKKNINSDSNIDNLINENTSFFINNNHIPVIELDKYSITPDYLEFQIIK